MSNDFSHAMTIDQHFSDDRDDENIEGEVLSPLERAREETYENLLTISGVSLPLSNDGKNGQLIRFDPRVTHHFVQFSLGITVMPHPTLKIDDHPLGSQSYETHPKIIVSDHTSRRVIQSLSLKSRRALAETVFMESYSMIEANLLRENDWKRLDFFRRSARKYEQFLLSGKDEPVPQETVRNTENAAEDWRPPAVDTKELEPAFHELLKRVRRLLYATLKDQPVSQRRIIQMFEPTNVTPYVAVNDDAQPKIIIECTTEAEGSVGDALHFAIEESNAIPSHIIAKAINSMQRGMPKRDRVVLAHHFANELLDYLEHHLDEMEELGEEQGDYAVVLRKNIRAFHKAMLARTLDESIEKLFDE